MNIIYHILIKYFKKEQFYTLLIIALSFLTTFIQISGISYLSSNVMKAVNHNNETSANQYFRYFIIVSTIFVILTNYYKIIQNQLLTDLRQWVRKELINLIILNNDEEYDEVNFTALPSPVIRLAASIQTLCMNLTSLVLPSLTLVILITLYFLYKNLFFGLFFLISNIFVVFYFYYFWGEIMKNKKDYETNANETEMHIIELMNNLDKIVYRGECHREIDIFTKKSDQDTEKSNHCYNYINYHIFVSNLFINIVVLVSSAYLLRLFFQKHISTAMFMTFFTTLLLYKEKYYYCVSSIKDYMDFSGRSENVINLFNNMKTDYNIHLNKESDVVNKENDNNIVFNSIRFENVNFKYKTGNKNVFKDLNITINTDNKIQGITGLSGNGKSTLIKMLLKMYKSTQGRILIDGVDINDIDSQFIRKQITYVNQNSRLFDTKVIENIFYGCDDTEKCKAYLDEILKYDKIAKLFRNVDIENKKCGLGGEHLSGGQRQCINIISGLVIPSSILILDEPTNALDIELKVEIINLIRDFKKYKKCIIIISHDKEIIPIFDEKIQL